MSQQQVERENVAAPGRPVGVRVTVSGPKGDARR